MRSNRYLGAMKFDIGYTDKAITPWGGMVLLRGMLDKIGFQQVVWAARIYLFRVLTGAIMPSPY